MLTILRTYMIHFPVLFDETQFQIAAVFQALAKLPLAYGYPGLPTYTPWAKEFIPNWLHFLGRIHQTTTARFLWPVDNKFLCFDHWRSALYYFYCEPLFFPSQPLHCSSGRCLGSLMQPYGVYPKRQYGVPRQPDEVKIHAKDFLKQYYDSMKLWVAALLSELPFQANWKLPIHLQPELLCNPLYRSSTINVKLLRLIISNF